MLEIVLKFFHFFTAVHYFYAIYYDCVYVLPEEIKLREYSFGGKFVYLTVLNVVGSSNTRDLKMMRRINFCHPQALQGIFFTIAFVNDFIGSNEAVPKKIPVIRKIKDYLFAAFAFPLALDVTLKFWSLYAIDRNLVFPEVLDEFFPSWLNHVLHSNITILIMVEMIVVHRLYPTRKAGVCGLMTFMLSYFVWMLITRYYAGKWTYPILDILDTYGRIGFFAGALCFPVLLYFLGEYLNKKIWTEKRILRANSLN